MTVIPILVTSLQVNFVSGPAAKGGWSMADFKTLVDIVQAIVTTAGIVAAGIWAYYRYIRQADRYPHIESSADIVVHGLHGDRWIVELIAALENKGKVEHRLRNFTFGLAGLKSTDQLKRIPEWGNQTGFMHSLSAGSFLPQNKKFFTIGPGVTAKYSYITDIPDDIAFAIVHCHFEYLDRPGYSHAMERTVRLPDQARAEGVASGA